MKRILLLVTLVAGPACAQPVGMAAHVSGDVKVELDGKVAPLRLLGRLMRGARVKSGPGGKATLVLFADGSRYQVSPGQSATVTSVGVTGARRLPAFSGPSADVVKRLGGARVGAAISRLAGAPQRLQRILPLHPGYYTVNRPQFQWLAVPGAAQYTYTLFDGFDNVVWSTRTAEITATYPADLPELLTRRPYLWRLAAFSASGKPLPQTRSGLVSVLTEADAATLGSSATALLQEARSTGSNTPMLLLAALYRDYGVPGRALELLEDEALRLEPGAAGAHRGIVEELSPFARALASSN